MPINIRNFDHLPPICRIHRFIDSPQDNHSAVPMAYHSECHAGLGNMIWCAPGSVAGAIP
jgi:hypothetical protein